MNRDNCYVDYKKVRGTYASQLHNTKEAHLYYKAVDCAYDVLSTSFLQYSMAAVFLMIAIMFWSDW